MLESLETYVILLLFVYKLTQIRKVQDFVHTFCHKLHDFTPTMPSIGRHIPFIFCIRKFPIHYRLNDQNR